MEIDEATQKRIDKNIAFKKCSEEHNCLKCDMGEIYQKFGNFTRLFCHEYWGEVEQIHED